MSIVLPSSLEKLVSDLHEYHRLWVSTLIEHDDDVTAGACLRVWAYDLLLDCEKPDLALALVNAFGRLIQEAGDDIYLKADKLAPDGGRLPSIRLVVFPDCEKAALLGLGDGLCHGYRYGKGALPGSIWSKEDMPTQPIHSRVYDLTALFLERAR